jgi:hypothetical protein
MRKAPLIFGALSVFVVGLLFGVALDWHTWFADGNTSLLGGRGRTTRYEVEPWGEALQVVRPKDKLVLVRPSKPTDGSVMTFDGGSFCDVPGSTCTVRKDAAPGTYFFSCDPKDSSNTDPSYSCPEDPGIQVRTSGTTRGEELAPFGYFADLFEIVRYTVTKVKPALIIEAGDDSTVGSNGSALGAVHPAARKNQVTPSAFVKCSGTTAEVDPRNPPAAPDTPISIPITNKMYWTSHAPLTITFTNPDMCAESSPVKSDGDNLASCTVNKVGTYSYTIAFDQGCTLSKGEQLTGK